SSWRLRFALDELREMLASRNLRAAVIDRTPALYRAPDGQRLTRGDEIQQWLHGRERASSFVILEDKEPLGALEANAVRTSPECGLLDEHVAAAAIALLQR
ncbi:MAG: HAD domain-containing protein, partial [Polyangiales bacterium]